MQEWEESWEEKEGLLNEMEKEKEHDEGKIKDILILSYL